MPTYVTLAEFTQQGIENVHDDSALVDRIRDEADTRGGELHDIYVTFGEYDVVMVSEFPDDGSYAQFVLTVASGGGLDTETLRAFTEEEFDDVVAGLVPPRGGPFGEQ